MKETKTLEYKETITNTFLKTVSAYANYEGGVIIFGIDDNGRKTGIENLESTCLDIENRINDSITPQPEYMLEINEHDKIITLSVKGGYHKPYLYKSQAYRRNDTATIAVDSLELTRLILEGKNMSYEDLPSDIKQLSFVFLAEQFKQKLSVEKFDTDILKTLNLYSDERGYNNAAAILADNSTFPGIDIAKFGENINIIHKRATFEHMSALEAYERSVGLYRDYYQYEEISGTNRRKVEKVPETAFREAVANALIHRLWDMNARIRILMHEDHIEVISPGGLPAGIKEAEYLSGKISILRNPIIGNVFFRLGIVEIFGTGILRIKEMYKDSIKKPSFEVSDNTIRVVLPVYETQLGLSGDELKIYGVLSRTIPKAIGDIMPNLPYGKTKVTKILKSLADKGIVKIDGNGRGTKYRLE